MDVMQEKGKKKVMLEADDLFERTKSKLNDMILPGRKTVSPGLVKRVVSQQLQEFEGFSYQSLRDLRGLLNNALLRG